MSKSSAADAQNHDPHGRPFLIGESRPMRRLRERIRKIGVSSIAVLVYGETGSGKELVARQLHAWSGRSRLVVINCAGIPETLLESELFGHVRGAFTGAARDRPGRFQAANKGTLFLDEIGELGLAAQAKLLRTLDTGEVQRVGEDDVRYVDVRLIAATNRDLEQAVREGRLRHDLYYRLAQAHINVPPLRVRGGDISLLARHFASETTIGAAAIGLLESYPWPGNVRELKAVVEVAAVESGGSIILPEHLPERIRHPANHANSLGLDDRAASDTSSNGRRRKLPADERDTRRAILDALIAAGGNKQRAAEELAISRGYLHVKIRDLSIRDGEWSDGRG